MATTDPLPPHFGDRYVLDPLFQDLAAAPGMSFGKAKRLILEALQDERILVSEHVAEGVWSLQQRDFATTEEAMRVEEKARALRNKFAFTAAEELFHEQTPPGGQTSLIKFEAWGYSITLTVDNYRLRIVDLIAPFPPESYSFRVVKSVTADELLAAASPVQPAGRRPMRDVQGEESESDRRDWQTTRAKDSLIKVFPPDGRVRKSMSVRSAREKALRCLDHDPNRGPPSEDSYRLAIKQLGRAP